MSDLYGRRLIVRVASGTTAREWDGLHVTFTINQTAGGEPNTAEISIYGLTEASRRMIADDGATVELRAGYVDTIALLFRGDIDEATPERDGADIVTRITASDGGRAIRQTVVNISRAADTPVDTVIGDVLDVLGLDRGSLARVTGTLKQGISALMPARQVLDELTASRGYRWSVQDGAIQIHEADAGTRDAVVVLTPETGLVGAPRRMTDRGNSGGVARRGVAARSLLQPQIRPGRRVRVEAEFIAGEFVCEKARHLGSTFGGDWYTELEAY